MAKNGQVPTKDLYLVQGTMKADQPTAHDFKAFRAAAKKVGVTLTIAKPAGAYRSLATQAAMHKYPAKYNVADASIMAPVGSSTHGYGTALDLYATKPGRNPQAWEWVLANARHYGFKQRDAKGDPHCFLHND